MSKTKILGLTSQSSKKGMSIAISILLISGIYAFAYSIEYYNALPVFGQTNNTTTTPMNATQANATSANTTKPVDGYGGPPTGPLTAVRHVFDDLLLECIISVSLTIKL